MDLPAQAAAFADTVRDGLAQVIGPLLDGETLGLQVSTGTELEQVEVHPLLCVTVTV